MKMSDFIDQIITRCQVDITGVSLDWSAAKLLANEALQIVQPTARQLNRDFFTTRKNFTQTALIALPDDFFEGIYVQVAGANRGGARVELHRDYVAVNMNSYSRGTAKNPTALFTQLGIELTPAVAGTLFYSWQYGDIDDEDTELTDIQPGKRALMPLIYMEDAVLIAVKLARQRQAEVEDKPSNAEQYLGKFQESQEQIHASENVEDIFETTIQKAQ